MSQSTHQPKVSIIIPVFNDVEGLERCLSALEQQTYPSDRYEIIVVDNGSAQSIAPIAAKYPHAIATFESQRGSYAARNKGIAIAQGEVLAFTDADCSPASDWLEQGVAALIANPDCGLVAGLVEFVFHTAHPNAYELFDSISGLQQRAFIEKYKFGVTANLFTQTWVFERVGLFDAALQSGGDFEWGVRVHRAGLPVVFSEQVRITHPARNSFEELRKKHVRVMRGHYGLMQRGVYSRPKFVLGAIADLLVPFAFVPSVLRHPKLASASQKLQAAKIAILIRYVRGWERLKLLISGIWTEPLAKSKS
ncbi:glycosyltransferase [Leptolyngbya sp. AN02str]|uniref:glycosyltransferase n=1 Tax=Leptolyngbya sp. AN02str TaxID=3423363 RepID=UPI003D31E1A0